MITELLERAHMVAVIMSLAGPRLPGVQLIKGPSCCALMSITPFADAALPTSSSQPVAKGCRNLREAIPGRHRTPLWSTSAPHSLMTLPKLPQSEGQARPSSLLCLCSGSVLHHGLRALSAFPGSFPVYSHPSNPSLILDSQWT